MSDYAQSLVARSAGLPAPGVVSLLPRPITRFEQFAMDDHAPSRETAADRFTDNPAPPLALTQTAPAIAERRDVHDAAPPDRQALPAEVEPGSAAPAVATSVRSPQSGTVAGGAVAPSDAPIARADRRASELIAVPTSPALAVGAVEVDLAVPLTAPASSIEPAPPAASVGHPCRSPAGEPVAASPRGVSISIGRILVELVEPRRAAPAVPASRPAPERTRGFAAFARARRGELR